MRYVGRSPLAYAERRDPVYRKWVRENYPCVVAGLEVQPGLIHRCSGILEFSHIEGRGIGGWDRYNGVTLCTEAHTAAPWSWHRGQKSFEKRFGLNLTQLAYAIGEEYMGSEDELAQRARARAQERLLIVA